MIALKRILDWMGMDANALFDLTTSRMEALNAMMPADTLKFDDWEIVFEDTAVAGAAQP